MIAASSGLVILPGNGTATLGSPVAAAPLGDWNQFALSGDFNGDGRRDLVLPGNVGGYGSSVDVYPGNGNFTFGTPTSLTTVWPATEGIVADLNGDGRPDVVTTNGEGGLFVSVFLNQGSLIFTAADIPLGPPSHLDRYYETTDVTAGDVNRDGRVDVLVSAGSPNSLYRSGVGSMFVLLGKGNGTFDSATEYALPPGPMQIVVGDFNRDGIVDVVTGNQSAIVRDDCYIPWKTWDSVSVMVGLGDGTFAGPWNFSIGDQSVTDPWWDPVSEHFSNTLVSLNTNDLNHDGATDLIASQGAVLLNIPAVANRAPTVDAGPDTVVGVDHESISVVRASDPDEDLLTWNILDGSGRVIATYPNGCGPPRNLGTNTFTVTVNDGHGHQATDTAVHTMLVDGKLFFEDGADVGAVRAAGSDSYDRTTDTYTVSGSGADIWGTADAFHVVAQDRPSTALNVRGNFRFTALVNSVEAVHAWTKAGLMIRENRNPGARHASVFVTPSKGVAFQRRTVENGTSIHTAGPATTAPVWVKLERLGDEITAYFRISNTHSWTVIGRQTLANFGPNAVAGLAVTSHADGTVATATFSHVEIEMLSTFAGAAIGAGSGSVTYDGQQFTVNGRGADIWNAADSFFYAYTRGSGNLTITARVGSLTSTDPWAKAGVMLREDLTAGSKQVMTVVTPARGVSMQYRPTVGGTSRQAANVPATVPGWVRLARHGDTFTSSWSTDGVNWTTLSAIDVPFATDFYFGLPVTSHKASRTATGLFDGVSFGYN